MFQTSMPGDRLELFGTFEDGTGSKIEKIVANLELKLIKFYEF
jgi:hypothetical protein